MRKSGQPALPGDALRRARDAGLRFVGWAFFFSVFVNILMLTGPLYMLQVYDRVLASGSEETLIALSILVAGLYGMMTLLDWSRTRMVARFGAQFQSDLDEPVFRASFSGPDGSGAQRTPPAAAQSDLEAVQGAFTSPAFVSLMDMPFTPLFVAAIFLFHPLLGWLALAGGTILIVVTILNQLLTHKRSSNAQIVSRQAQAFSENLFSGQEVVRAQGMLDAVTDRWVRMRVEALRQTITARDWTGTFTAFTKGFRMFLQSAMLGLGAWLVLQHELTAGAMIAGSILLGRALAPIESSLGQWPMVQRARLGWTSLGKALAGVTDEQQPMQLPVPKARLAVRQLSVLAPGVQEPILYNIAFTLEPGQALGVIGRSGSGKSTLAKTVLGLVRPSAGEVRLGGATIEQYGSAQLGRHIGYLPQDPVLFQGTLAENIARLGPDADPDAVVAAARKANAHEVILGLPQGYDTVIGSRDSRLSGGQRQRIALARALFGDPQMLILDEPNSALDAEGTEALNAAVREFKAQGRSVIIMTHRPMAISECDLLAVVDKGRMTAFGPRDEILRSMVQNADQVKRTIGGAGA